MKKFISMCAAMVLLLAASVSCTKTEQGSEPSIKPSVEGDVLIAPEGGSMDVVYTLSNPVDGGEVSASCTADWVSEINCSVAGVVSFSVAANTEDAERTAVLTIEYKYSGKSVSCDVNLVQQFAGSDSPQIVCLEEGPVKVSAAGGAAQLAYEIKNPVADGALNARASCDWIDSFDYSEDGVIKFNVSANKMASVRTAKITVTYKFGQSSVYFVADVEQEGSSEAATFEISVDDIQATSAYCHVRPSDKEMTFISLTIKKDLFERYSTDDEFFQSEIEYFTSMAAMWGTDMYTLVTSKYQQQGDLDYQPIGLDPSTDFYCYAYGMTFDENKNMVRLTDVYTYPFKTVTPEAPEDGLSVTVDCSGTTATVMVVPANEDDLFYLDCISEERLEGYTGTISEKLVAYGDNYVKGLVGMGFAPDKIGWYGAKSYSFANLKEGAVYYGFAYIMDKSTGMGISDAYYQEFTPGAGSSAVPSFVRAE